MSLKSLRSVRAQIEEAITMELARITQQLVEMEQRSVRLATQMQSDTDAYRAQMEQGLSIEEMREWQARMDAQQAALTETHRAIGTLSEAWYQTQARLTEASQDKKVLDRLAERRERTHRKEVERLEQLITDEAAYRQHGSAGRRAS